MTIIDVYLMSIYVKLMSIWCEIDVYLMTNWCLFDVKLMSIWCQIDVYLMSNWCLFDVKLMSILCLFDVDLMLISMVGRGGLKCAE